MNEKILKIPEYAKKQIENSPFISARDCFFIKINEICYDNDFPRREALENIFTALSNNLDYSLVYILRGDGCKINLYFGIVSNYNTNNNSKFSAYNLGTILKETFLGNFQGSSIENINNENELYSEIISPLSKTTRGAVITGIPSVDHSYEDKGLLFQGVDRLVNSMNGCTGNWQLLIIAKPLALSNIKKIKDEVFTIYNKYSKHAKQNIQESEGYNTGTNKSKTIGENTSFGSNKSSTTGRNKSETTGKNSSSGTSSSSTTGTNESETTGKNSSSGSNSSSTTGTNESETTGKNSSSGSNSSSATGQNKSEAVNVNTSSQLTSKSTTTGTNESKTTGQNTSSGSSSSSTTGQNESKTTGKNSSSGSSTSSTTGQNESKTTGKNTSYGSSTSSTTGDNSSSSTGTNESTGTSTSVTDGSSQGVTKTTSVSSEIIQKDKQEILKYIDEDLNVRLGQGMAKGYFNTTVYALANTRLARERLISSVNAIYQGEGSSFNPLRATIIEDLNYSKIKSAIMHFLPIEDTISNNREIDILYSNTNSNKNTKELSTGLSAVDLSLFCGLPVKEIPGVQIREGVDFGLCPKIPNKKSNSIILGNVLQRGYKLANQKIAIDKEMLSRHIFIAGVTGSGKTVTSKKLLMESNLPFLIIEPAKTEYRSLIKNNPDIAIYTLGNEQLAPFRMNIFELLPSEQINTHVDMLKAAFTAAFPMEAAMPYLLEEAMYEAYIQYGWNINGWDCQENANYHTPNPWNASGKYWPTMDDLLIALKKVVDSKGFDVRLKSDYEASLIARFKNLCVGSKGLMLNCRKSIDFEKMIMSKVILELDGLKSPEDKSFVMGLIIARVSEAIRQNFRKNPKFKHITLIEEAHRLLENLGITENGPQKHAVGMFTDLLAEVRKYGESLIIVDQIPNKLAPEVMKNTNIKIIHKLFAKDDREAVGDTIGLDEAQNNFLTQLRTGEAIVYSGNWSKAVAAKVQMFEKKQELSEIEIEKNVKEHGIKQLYENMTVFSSELINAEITKEVYQLYITEKKFFFNFLNRSTRKSIEDSKRTGKKPPPIEPWQKNFKQGILKNKCNKDFIPFIQEAIINKLSIFEQDNCSQSKKSFIKLINFLINDKNKLKDDEWEEAKDILIEVFAD